MKKYIMALLIINQFINAQIKELSYERFTELKSRFVLIETTDRYDNKNPIFLEKYINQKSKKKLFAIYESISYNIFYFETQEDVSAIVKLFISSLYAPQNINW